MITLKHHHRLPFIVLAGLLLALPLQDARSATTRVWVVSSFADFDAGEGEGALINSAGRLLRGQSAKRQKLPGVELVFAMIESAGALYLGTGNKGEVWVHRGGRTTKLATLKGAVLVTCFAKGPGGRLYAGTLPEGRIFSIAPGGQVKPFAKLDAQHIWDLHWDAKARRLFAATGPKGKLFAVDATGKSQLWWDSEESHLLTLATDAGGVLHLGTAPGALVFRLEGKGRARAIHDFDGNEVRALVGHAKGFYVAVNKLRHDTGGLFKAASALTAKGGTKIKGKGGKPHKLRIPRLGAKKGSGGLFYIAPSGASRQLIGLTEGYFTALQRVGQRVYAAEGTRGKIYTVFPDFSVASAQDVSERQVLSLALGGKLRAFGTGDGPSLYRLGVAGAKPQAYRSKAYDCGAIARFGILAWRASGAVTVDSRSGNTAKPDKGWSAWKALTLRGRAPGGFQRGLVRSPNARFVQFRVRWPGASKAEVTDLRLHFTPLNHAPRWTSLSVGGQGGSGKTDVVKASWLGSATPDLGAPAKLKIKWKVKDPDGDPLVYRVSWRAQGDVSWKPLDPAKPVHTDSNVKWRTNNLPDGWYEIRVEASDERANPAGQVLRRAKISGPVLVDHRKPELVGLRVTGGARGAAFRVVGLARDSYSRITGIAYSLNLGRSWQQVAAVDGSFDQEAERFDFRLLARNATGARLAPGNHTLLLRVFDAAGNGVVVKHRLVVR